jgi:hypothetical protein
MKERLTKGSHDLAGRSSRAGAARGRGARAHSLVAVSTHETSREIATRKVALEGGGVCDDT